MSPWTALLESLHSALIDELIERHPKPKPELGLPSRHSAWTVPAGSVDKILICRVEIGDASGFAALAVEPGFEKKLKIDALKLWAALIKRSGTEFTRRGIQPKITSPDEVPAVSPLPRGIPAPTRLIWIPIRLGGVACFLGIGT